MAQNISPRFNPQKTVLLSFLGAIGFFTALLKLSASSQNGLSWIDALFTATSGVCVTGLSVIDIGTELTFFGQIGLLAAIQAGGLGIMTFSVFFVLLFRGRTTLVSRLSVGLKPYGTEVRDLIRILGFVLAMTLCFEAAGSILLFQRFKELNGGESAVFYSIFHSVSAFCNAGFSLFPDSLERFQKEFYLPSCIAVLIVLGGLGFMVLEEVRAWLDAFCKGQKFRLSLHSRVCLSVSGALIVFGALMVFFLERDNLLSELSFPQQVMNSFFLSITSRTAGFHTLNTAFLTNASLFFVMMYMFIGGCPGSTAGGIKITTFAVLAALVKDLARFRQSASLFKRKIPNTAAAKAVAIAAAGFVLVTVFALCFQITEKAGAPMAFPRTGFLDLFFETMSGFGTVGLSTGAVSSLSLPGKLLMIMLMFIGRVGPLTLALGLMMRRKTGPRFEYVEEEILIG